jgi:hypothetical protein
MPSLIWLGPLQHPALREARKASLESLQHLGGPSDGSRRTRHTTWRSAEPVCVRVTYLDI